MEWNEAERARRQNDILIIIIVCARVSLDVYACVRV